MCLTVLTKLGMSELKMWSTAAAREAVLLSFFFTLYTLNFHGSGSCNMKKCSINSAVVEGISGEQEEQYS